MLEFQELTVKEGARLRPYYETCDYRLCEYSLGVKLMWRDYLHPWFTEAAGCLIIRNGIDPEPSKWNRWKCRCGFWRRCSVTELPPARST